MLGGAQNDLIFSHGASDSDAKQPHLQAASKRRKAPGGIPGSLIPSHNAAINPSLQTLSSSAREDSYAAGNHQQNARTRRQAQALEKQAKALTKTNQANLQMAAEHRHSQSSPATIQEPAPTGYAAQSTTQTTKTWKNASSPTHHRTRIMGCPWPKGIKSLSGER